MKIEQCEFCNSEENPDCDVDYRGVAHEGCFACFLDEMRSVAKLHGRDLDMFIHTMADSI